MTQQSPADGDVVALLNDRDGQPTEVRLSDGRRLDVRNIAWGYDMGDEHAHVTTNVSPSIDGTTIDFFYTSEVVLVTDSEGVVLYRG